MNVGRCVASALLLAALAGCSSYPISSDLRDQATQVPFSRVKADPEGTRGKVVIWGGRIIDVVNNTNGGTIYVLCLPVRSDGRPIDNQSSPGRFMAVSPGFLDPEIYPPGTRITVAGPLDGVWTEPLEDIDYTYPVVEIQQVHLWPEQREPSPSSGPNWNVYWGPPPPTWWWYTGPMMHRPMRSPGFHGSFHAGVRVGPGPPRGPPGRRRW